MKRFLLGVLVTAAAALPIAAVEYTRFELVPVTPALRVGEVADCTGSSVLSVPPVFLLGAPPPEIGRAPKRLNVHREVLGAVATERTQGGGEISVAVCHVAIATDVQLMAKRARSDAPTRR